MILEQLLAGFAAALDPLNMLFMALGVALGIVVGIMPGLGSVTALSILIPVTFYMSPLMAIAFLVGVNKGGTSGGAIPAILLPISASRVAGRSCAPASALAVILISAMTHRLTWTRCENP